jgi:hypothetical protein
MVVGIFDSKLALAGFIAFVPLTYSDFARIISLPPVEGVLKPVTEKLLVIDAVLVADSRMRQMDASYVTGKIHEIFLPFLVTNRRTLDDGGILCSFLSGFLATADNNGGGENFGWPDDGARDADANRPNLFHQMIEGAANLCNSSVETLGERVRSVDVPAMRAASHAMYNVFLAYLLAKEKADESLLGITAAVRNLSTQILNADKDVRRQMQWLIMHNIIAQFFGRHVPDTIAAQQKLAANPPGVNPPAANPPVVNPAGVNPPGANPISREAASAIDFSKRFAADPLLVAGVFGNITARNKCHDSIESYMNTLAAYASGTGSYIVDKTQAAIMSELIKRMPGSIPCQNSTLADLKRCIEERVRANVAPDFSVWNIGGDHPLHWLADILKCGDVVALKRGLDEGIAFLTEHPDRSDRDDDPLNIILQCLIEYSNATDTMVTQEQADAANFIIDNALRPAYEEMSKSDEYIFWRLVCESLE